MEDHTELELRLFKYIRFLIGHLNVLSSFYEMFRQNNSLLSNWTQKLFDNYNKDLKDMNIDFTNQDMLDDLNKEFNWDAKIVDLSKGKE